MLLEHLLKQTKPVLLFFFWEAALPSIVVVAISNNICICIWFTFVVRL